MGGQAKGRKAITSQGDTGGRGTTRRLVTRTGEGQALEQGSSPVETVLGQPELLELILDYAIHDQNAEKRLKTLRSVRLVNKSWLTGVTNVMRKNKEPLFKLKLTKDNSLKGAPVVEAQGKLLDVFAETVKNGLEGPFPTFSLKILKDFFRRENYDSLVAFMRQCAGGLVALGMFIPENGGSLPGVLSMEKLPLLQKLAVTFTGQKVAANLSGMELDFGNPTNVICLIHSFLSKAHSLKEFSAPWVILDGTVTAPLAPLGFEILTFPVSITNLDLRCEMTSQQLEVLVRNKLPNVVSLRLLLKNLSGVGELLSQILTNFSEHLRTLIIYGASYAGPTRMTNVVRFPVMKKLTYISTSDSGFELEDQHSTLNTCFPKLKTLCTFYQTPEMLRKWTTTTPIVSVKILCLSLIDETSSDFILPVSLELMQSIHLTFPNLRELTLEMSSGTQACGFKYVFMEMRQLIYLRIVVHGSESIINSDYWDSIFTGAPVPVVVGLRESPEYWNNLELKDKVPSIKMLTELQRLSLQAVVKSANAEVMQPLISDLTFTFGLLKMPKLKNLFLYGRFKASTLMTETWKKNGCWISYSPFARK